MLQFNLPNILTLLRLALIPILFLVFYLPFDWSRPLAAILFVLAALTDWLDGYLARRLQQTTAFGEFLDPVADKLIVIVALLLLFNATPGWLLLLPVMIIISREVVVSALREWMARLGEHDTVAVNKLGKWKTATQMIAITLLLYQQPLAGLSVWWIGVSLLWLAAILTLWSMWVYLRAAWPHIS